MVHGLDKDWPQGGWAALNMFQSLICQMQEPWIKSFFEDNLNWHQNEEISTSFRFIKYHNWNIFGFLSSVCFKFLLTSLTTGLNFESLPFTADQKFTSKALCCPMEWGFVGFPRLRCPTLSKVRLISSNFSSDATKHGVQLSFAHNWMDDVTDGRALPHMDAQCIAHPPLCFVTMCQLQPSSGWAGLD